MKSVSKFNQISGFQMIKMILILSISLGLSTAALAQNPTSGQLMPEKPSYSDTMKIEIWSDIACPFCYLGKRKLDSALAQAGMKAEVSIVYRSFQLNPALVTDTSLNIHDYLVREKGMQMSRVRQMNSYIVESGRQNGIDFSFDKVIVANTFRAHSLLHFAARYGKQIEAKEMLFRAYFTEGKNVDDTEVLALISTQLGLDEREFRTALESNAYADAISRDYEEAVRAGVRGVPYFVINGREVVSGAQDISVFVDALQKAAK